MSQSVARWRYHATIRSNHMRNSNKNGYLHLATDCDIFFALLTAILLAFYSSRQRFYTERYIPAWTHLRLGKIKL